MDVTLSYDASKDVYLVYLGASLMVATRSYVKAVEQFNHYCDQITRVEDHEDA